MYEGQDHRSRHHRPRSAPGGEKAQQHRADGELRSVEGTRVTALYDRDGRWAPTLMNRRGVEEEVAHAVATGMPALCRRWLCVGQGGGLLKRVG